MDTAGRAGLDSSLALDAAGRPRISYTEYLSNQLRYAAWNGAAWELQVVDTAVAGYINTSLVLDGAGKPCISYTRGGNADLKYAAWTGSAWALETVDSAGNTGWYSSLVLDGAGAPAISYYDQTNGALRLARRGGRDVEQRDRGHRGRCGPVHVAGAGRRRQPPHQLPELHRC